MGSYKVVFKPSVHKDLRQIHKDSLARIMQRMEGLSTQPRPRQALKLAGADRLYRIRVGDYRIIYELDDKANQVVIHYIRHRREVYRK